MSRQSLTNSILVSVVMIGALSALASAGKGEHGGRPASRATGRQGQRPARYLRYLKPDRTPIQLRILHGDPQGPSVFIELPEEELNGVGRYLLPVIAHQTGVTVAAEWAEGSRLTFSEPSSSGTVRSSTFTVHERGPRGLVVVPEERSQAADGEPLETMPQRMREMATIIGKRLSLPAGVLTTRGFLRALPDGNLVALPGQAKP